jgi:hypothetical protein
VSTVSFALSFVLIQIRTRACRLFRLQRFLIHAAIDNRFFSVYTTLGHPAMIFALGYLSAISILQLYYTRPSCIDIRPRISIGYWYLSRAVLRYLTDYQSRSPMVLHNRQQWMFFISQLQSRFLLHMLNR